MDQAGHMEIAAFPNVPREQLRDCLNSSGRLLLCANRATAMETGQVVNAMTVAEALLHPQPTTGYS